MKVPFFLAEHGYQPDPENPLRFVNPDGHPWHPVTFKDARQKNHGECIRGMLEAMRRATIDGLPPAPVLGAVEVKMPPGVCYVDEQCDGCRWSWAAGAPANDGAACVGYCYFHEHRVEKCPQQEIIHVRKPWGGYIAHRSCGAVTAITVTDGNGNYPRRLTKKDYHELAASGMLWEFHPGAPDQWPE